MRKSSHLLFTALVGISLLISVPGFAQVNGFNVTLINYGQDNINSTGKFEQTEPGKWAETNPNGSNQFTERSRDEWSVYLFDPSRDIPIQINLHRKEIYIYYDRPTKTKLYSIVSAEIKPMTGGGNTVPTTGGSGYVINQPTMVTGNNVTFVSYGPSETDAIGRYEQTGPGKWKQTNDRGVVNVNFEERGRSNESVWLYDMNSLVGYQFDLRNKKIYSNYDRISKALVWKVVAIDAGAYTTNTIINTNLDNPVINTTTTAPNPFTASDMEKIIKWIAAEVADVKVEYCYRQSYGRGVGEPLSSCPPGTEKDGLLCYPVCNAGFYGVGPVCWQSCPSGYRNDGAYCAKPAAYGRGTGYANWNEKKCNNENPQGCEKYGAMWYPRCRSGFSNAGCCVCSPVCPSGMTDIGVSCQKQSYTRTAGNPMICPPNLQEDAGLCYTRCRAGYHGVGPFCYQDCPVNQPVNCAAGCAKNTGACVEKTVSQITATIELAVTIITLGQSSGLKASKASLVTAIKAGDKVAAKAAARACVKEFVAGFTQLTTKKVLRKLREEMAENSIKWVAEEYAKAQIKLAMQEEFSAEDLRDLAGLDPTGVAGVVEAFWQPKCNNPPEFPLLSKRY